MEGGAEGEVVVQNVGATGDAIRLGGLETKNRRAATGARASAVRTEAEINRRKSLLPSALSGPFRLTKIIYRKDWSVRVHQREGVSEHLLFPSDEFRDGPPGDAEISKKEKEGKTHMAYRALDLG